MLILATGQPSFAIEGAQIVLTLPNGKDRLQVALTLNQLFAIEQSGRVAVKDFYEKRKHRGSEGEVVAFTRKRKGGR